MLERSYGTSIFQRSTRPNDTEETSFLSVNDFHSINDQSNLPELLARSAIIAALHEWDKSSYALIFSSLACISRVVIKDLRTCNVLQMKNSLQQPIRFRGDTISWQKKVGFTLYWTGYWPIFDCLVCMHFLLNKRIIVIHWLQEKLSWDLPRSFMYV